MFSKPIGPVSVLHTLWKKMCPYLHANYLSQTEIQKCRNEFSAYSTLNGLNICYYCEPEIKLKVGRHCREGRNSMVLCMESCMLHRKHLHSTSSSYYTGHGVEKLQQNAILKLEKFLMTVKPEVVADVLLTQTRYLDFELWYCIKYRAAPYGIRHFKYFLLK